MSVNVHSSKWFRFFFQFFLSIRGLFFTGWRAAGRQGSTSQFEGQFFRPWPPTSHPGHSGAGRGHSHGQTALSGRPAKTGQRGTHSRSHNLKEEILKCSSLSVTCQMMTQQLITSDCLLWVIGSSSRRNSNRRDAEPTRQIVTPGRRARVRQTKCSFLFRICHPPQHLYWLLNQIVPFNYTALQKEGMTECEARTLSDFGCGKTMFAGFFPRNGTLTQQPRTGCCRLH